MPRFNDPTSGTISIGGHDLRNMRLQDVRGIFGVAFQDAFLFNSTILDNLRYARPTATTAEIIAACKLTGAHHVIERLPEGYDTRIGNQGVELSHGQKQRINLARALVRKPQTLIIDEITASIEASAAKQIIKDVLDHMAGRTVIIVTHDPSILQLVHRVVTLDHKTITSNQLTDDYTMKHPSIKSTHLGSIFLAMLLLIGATGCSTTTTTSMIAMEQPRSTGATFESEGTVDLDALARAIDDALGQPKLITFAQDIPEPVEPVIITPEEIADLIPEQDSTASNNLFVALEPMNTTEIGELIDLIATKYSDSGYSYSGGTLDGVLPVPPEGVIEHLTHCKEIWWLCIHYSPGVQVVLITTTSYLGRGFTN